MLKKLFIISFFLISIIEIFSETMHFNLPTSICKSLVIPILLIAFLDYKNYKISKIDKLIITSFLISYIGCNFVFYFGKIPNSLIFVSLIFQTASIFQIFAIYLLLNKNINSSTDGISKFLIILSISMLVIFFLVPNFKFSEQIFVFSRTIENCFFFGLIFRNKKLHPYIQTAFWLGVSTDILYAFSFHIHKIAYDSAFVTGLFHTSNFLFIIGYLKTQEKIQKMLNIS